MSNGPAALSKLGNAPPSAPSPSNSQFGGSNNFDSRRSGGSGSHGAGSTTRSGNQPRKDQGSKNKHKSSKRFRTLDEDAEAESVCISVPVLS